MLDLEPIKEREKAATEGPWTWQGDLDQDAWLGPPNTPGFDPVLDDGSARGEYGQTIKPSSPDGQFLAHARTDIPALVAEVEELRGG